MMQKAIPYLFVVLFLASNTAVAENSNTASGQSSLRGVALLMNTETEGCGKVVLEDKIIDALEDEVINLLGDGELIEAIKRASSDPNQKRSLGSYIINSLSDDELKDVLNEEALRNTSNEREVDSQKPLLVNKNAKPLYEIMKPLTGPKSPLGRLFKDLNLELTGTDTIGDNSNGEDKNALAVDFDYKKFLCKGFEGNVNRFSGIAGGITFRGNIPLEGENPRDFMDGTLRLGYFSSWGGHYTGGRKKLETTVIKTLSDIEKKKNYSASDERQHFKKLVSSELSDQYQLNVVLETGVESEDSKFEEKQFTLGLNLGFLLRGWKQGSVLGRINIFDYVPAIIRRLSGLDSEFSPRGSVFPTVNVGLSRVFPQDRDLRAKAGDGSDFWRYEVKSGFSSPLARWKDKYILWENSFRYYAEINSDDMVEQSDIEEHAYFSSAVKLPNGMYFSYSAGKLPLDGQDDHVYKLGFSYKFQ